jgi:TldD protein
VRDRRMVREAVHRAIEALTAQPAPAGEMPVVLGAGSSGILLHEAIGHGMEADFNRKGISIYADKIGTRIAPPGVTIVDDATLPSARGSLNVDDEAGTTERTVLVEDGTLKTFLHDRISSRHYGVPSTGSGRRESFRHPVLPRMRCTYMEPGAEEPSDIIKGVSRGIFCDVFANGEVQIGAGGFSFYVRHGYLIEEGRLTRPIKDINIIGNGPQVLASIEAVGNDLVIDEGGWTCGKDGQQVPVSQGMPTVRVAKLSVGGGAR